MVFFTCNNCGESVKKPSVEKHYTRCRAGHDKFLSCMDCLKDFRGEEYVAHTKCISEVQKYSGKDYVHKEAKNSGAKKQEGWTDIVHSILENSEYSLSGGTRSAFQKLQSFENVPRKKAKFQNFVANCMRMPKAQAEEVWNVLEKELEKMKQSRQQEVAAMKLAQEAAKKESEEKEQGQKKRHKSESSAAEDGEPGKKKSKKIKAAANGDVDENLDVPKKKKSKKTEYRDATAIVNETEKNPSKKPKASVIEDAADIPVEPKQKKSKKLLTEENGELISENGHAVLKKTKNSKSTEDECEAAHVDELQSKKSNKTKPAANGNALEQGKEEVLNENDSVVTKYSKKAKPAEIGVPAESGVAMEEPGFSWPAVLAKVAGTRAEGISVEKLKKKVLKKYTASLNEAATSAQLLKKFEKKFKKYLKRTPGLKVEGDVVKAC